MYASMQMGYCIMDLNSTVNNVKLFIHVIRSIEMKRLVALTSICLAGVSLAACGNNNKQAKENSSLRAQNSSLLAKKQKQENSSLKVENASLKNNKDNQSANNSNNTNNSNNSQEDPANLSDVEVAQRVKDAKGDTSPEYNTVVTNNGDGTYDVELRKDAPNGEVSNMIGTYTYNAKTGAITTKFESGLD